MGVDERTGRRALVDLAKDCIARTNACITTVEEIRTAHNGLRDKVDEQFDAVDKRITGSSKLATDAQDDVDEAHKRIDNLISTACWLTERVNNFEGMTFWQRLRWAFTGRVPELPEAQDADTRRLAAWISQRGV
jgi:hypothetical protein